MENVRVLWLGDGQCILFNSLEHRITSRCPPEVGKVLERLQAGDSEDAAMRTIPIGVEERERVLATIRYVAGPARACTEMPLTAEQFHNVIVLCPSNNCNLACIYCSGALNDDPSAHMSLELASDALDFYFRHVGFFPVYTLQFHGAGEPMLNFDVVRQSVAQARRYAQQRGARLFCRLSTNGVYSRDRAEWVAANFHHVSLSLDGPPDIHNRHRPSVGGQGTYDIVLRNMRIFQSAGILKRMNVVITPTSLERMLEVVHHLGQLGGIKEIRLLPMAFCGRCEVTGLEHLDTARFDQLFDEAGRIAASYGMKSIVVIQEADYFTRHYCGACGFNMVVAPDGHISTCVEVLSEAIPGASELLVGRWNRDSRDIRIDWGKVAHLRSRMENLDGQCKECTFRTNCAGNCLVRAARNRGTVMKSDPEACTMTKAALSRFLTEMADGRLTDHLMYRVEEAR
jgi:uncharacterized protein